MEDMKLIGMDGVKALLLDIVRNQEAYRRGKASIPNMIIMMNPRNGQTYTTEAITDVLAEYKLREFHGLDEYLEYKPDGSKASVDWMFSDIEDNAIYDNRYKGVVSVDVSKLVNVLNQYQMKCFEENIRRVAECATVIIYCATDLGVKGEKLVNRLRKVLDKVKVIDCYDFTSRDYAEMIVQNVLDRGIEVKDEEKIIKVLGEVVSNKEVSRAQDAIHLAEQLVFYADYSKNIPVLSFGKTKAFKSEFCKEAQYEQK